MIGSAVDPSAGRVPAVFGEYRRQGEPAQGVQTVVAPSLDPNSATVARIGAGRLDSPGETYQILSVPKVVSQSGDTKTGFFLGLGNR